MSQTEKNVTKGTTTDYKLVAYALSIGTKVADIGWPWSAISSHFLGICCCCPDTYRRSTSCLIRTFSNVQTKWTLPNQRLRFDLRLLALCKFFIDIDIDIDIEQFLETEYKIQGRKGALTIEA